MRIFENTGGFNMLLVSAFQDSIPKIFRYVITVWQIIRDIFSKLSSVSVADLGF
jgi:hypothetical protein